MAGRIRTIKPEILEDEPACALSDAAWRLWVSSWLLADDYGRFRAGARYLAAQVWQDTGKASAADAAFIELATHGFVRIYEVDNQRYAEIKRHSWSRHQRIDKPGSPRVPVPSDSEFVALDQLRSSPSVSEPSKPSFKPSSGNSKPSFGGSELSLNGSETKFDETPPTVPSPQTYTPPEHELQGSDDQTKFVSLARHAHARGGSPISDLRSTTTSNTPLDPPLAGGPTVNVGSQVELPILSPPSSKPSRRKAKRALPADWIPNDHAYRVGSECGYDRSAVDANATRFRGDALAHDRRYADWNQAFYNWLRNQQRYDARGFTARTLAPRYRVQPGEVDLERIAERRRQEGASAAQESAQSKRPF